MAYIEAHQSVLSHRKTLRLSRLLAMDRFAVVGRLVALWAWAVDNAPDGLIREGDGELLADVMGFAGEASELCCALVSSGFLDTCDEGLVIHDWYAYAGRLIDQRKANADRQARFRERGRQQSNARGSGTVTAASTQSATGGNRDVTVTSPSRNGATVPNRTVADRNGEGETEGDIVGGGSPVVVVAADAAPDDLGRSVASRVFAEESEPMALARALVAGIRSHKPDAKVPRSPQGWARDFDLMLRVDHRPRETIEAVMAFAMGSSFWRGVILSAGKLRDKFDTLEIQRREDRSGARHGANGRHVGERRFSAPRPGSPEYYAEYDRAAV